MNDPRLSPERLLGILADVEWRAIRRGPGSGPMFSGDDGREHPACPYCGGIRPTAESRQDFHPSAIGHRAACLLGPTLRLAGR